MRSSMAGWFLLAALLAIAIFYLIRGIANALKGDIVSSIIQLVSGFIFLFYAIYMNKLIAERKRKRKRKIEASISF